MWCGSMEQREDVQEDEACFVHQGRRRAGHYRQRLRCEGARAKSVVELRRSSTTTKPATLRCSSRGTRLDHEALVPTTRLSKPRRRPGRFAPGRGPRAFVLEIGLARGSIRRNSSSARRCGHRRRRRRTVTGGIFGTRSGDMISSPSARELRSVQEDAGHVPDALAEHADRRPEDVAESLLRGHVRPPSARWSSALVIFERPLTFRSFASSYSWSRVRPRALPVTANAATTARRDVLA